MEPEEARDVRTLLSYDAATAGGLMNPEPVVLGTDATVADALAAVRNEEITPAMAALAFICRSPLDTPTGRYLGAVHIQRLLREPPSVLAAGLIDPDITPLTPQSNIAQVSRYFATYDLVCAPVVDARPPTDWCGDRGRRPRSHPAQRLARSAAGPPGHGGERWLGRIGWTFLGAEVTWLPRMRMDQDAFGSFAESFARWMGTAQFLIWMTVLIIAWVVLEPRHARGSGSRSVPVPVPDPGAVAAGLIRSSPHPASAEPPGGP